MQILQLVVLPHQAEDAKFLSQRIKLELKVEKFEYKIVKRSIDARKKTVKINLKLEVYEYGEEIPSNLIKKEYPSVHDKKSVIVVGCGPAGMFAALKLIEKGLKPIMLERGKNVRERRRDLAAITKKQEVNPNSNYCFGEGGAGTYSDGKLYTRSKKRGDVSEVLQILVQHGATENILVDAHPHIGTNKLPQVIVNIRETILNSGGEIHFNSMLTDFIIENNSIKGVEINNDRVFKSNKVILATGHSARDIFYLLDKKGIYIENKPFALGVRVEHPQKLIDTIQYHSNEKNEFLPPASYKLVQQVKQRGVFSFCMCPGGIVAPCATAPGEIVTNGWSPSKRNNPYANSGIVVTVEEEDLIPYKKYGALAGLKFQEEIEQRMFKIANNDQIKKNGQIAPAQRLIDFIKGIKSETLPNCSYTPGVKSVALHNELPKAIATRLQEGFKAFGRKMNGYLTKDAIIIGVESRTSSPVKIPRDKVTLSHPIVEGLFPCGEGGGYAGGIVSAAIDGQKCAEACV